MVRERALPPHLSRRLARAIFAPNWIAELTIAKMMSAEDRELLDAFARRIRLVAPSAAIWAFGSRARGSAHPESDLDLLVVVPEATRDLRESVYSSAWEIGFEHGRLLAPVILTAEDFERGPMSASTLVANVRREGVAA